MIVISKLLSPGGVERELHGSSDGSSAVRPSRWAVSLPGGH